MATDDNGSKYPTYGLKYGPLISLIVGLAFVAIAFIVIDRLYDRASALDAKVLTLESKLADFNKLPRIIARASFNAKLGSNTDRYFLENCTVEGKRGSPGHYIVTFLNKPESDFSVIASGTNGFVRLDSPVVEMTKGAAGFQLISVVTDRKSNSLSLRIGDDQDVALVVFSNKPN